MIRRLCRLLTVVVMVAMFSVGLLAGCGSGGGSGTSAQYGTVLVRIAKDASTSEKLAVVVKDGEVSLQGALFASKAVTKAVFDFVPQVSGRESFSRSFSDENGLEVVTINSVPAGCAYLITATVYLDGSETAYGSVQFTVYVSAGRDCTATPTGTFTVFPTVTPTPTPTVDYSPPGPAVEIVGSDNDYPSVAVQESGEHAVVYRQNGKECLVSIYATSSSSEESLLTSLHSFKENVYRQAAVAAANGLYLYFDDNCEGGLVYDVVASSFSKDSTPVPYSSPVPSEDKLASFEVDRLSAGLSDAGEGLLGATNNGSTIKPVMRKVGLDMLGLDEEINCNTAGDMAVSCGADGVPVKAFWDDEGNLLLQRGTSSSPTVVVAKTVVPVYYSSSVDVEVKGQWVAVAWFHIDTAAYPTVPSDTGVYVRRFRVQDDGTLVAFDAAPVVAPDTLKAESQTAVRVTIDATGRAMVLWTDYRMDPSVGHLVGMALPATADSFYHPFVVDVGDVYCVNGFDIGCDAKGRCIIVWPLRASVDTLSKVWKRDYPIQYGIYGDDPYPFSAI